MTKFDLTSEILILKNKHFDNKLTLNQINDKV